MNYSRKKKWSHLFKGLETGSQETIENVIPSYEYQNPDSRIHRTEKKRIIQDALNSLPKNQRAAFILHTSENIPYANIAKIMNCSISAVESRIHRAKINLQKRLIKRLDDIL